MAEMSATLAHEHTHDDHHVQRQAENQKLAIWLYLGSEVVIFSILIVVYAIFRVYEPDSVHHVHDELGIGLVTANTFLLLSSSWAMVMGLRAIQMGKRQPFLMWMSVVAALGVIFLVGQYIEYSLLANLQITLGSNHPEFSTFGMRFYAPTAFHGAHVFVGVLLCLQVMWLGRKGFYDKNPIGVELFGLYWHFVDVVWILLFTLIYLV